MKTEEFKKIIKKAVREAIQEELRDILLEAVKPSGDTLVEQKVTTAPKTNSTSPIPAEKSQADIINGLLLETAKSGTWRGALNMTSQDVSPDSFAAMGESGALPGGEVPLDMILKMTNGGRG